MFVLYFCSYTYRINEFNDGGKENIFLMEHKAKVELLQNVGALDSNLSGHTTPESSCGNGSGMTTPVL